MKILQIAPKIPWPIDDGSKLSIYIITEGLLKRGVEVHLAAPEISSTKANQFLNVPVYPLPVNPKNKISGVITNLFTSSPYNISKYFSFEALKLLKLLIQREKFDAVHVDHLHMARYGIELKKYCGATIVLREHNFESEIMRKYVEFTRNPLLSLYGQLQYRRLVDYEAWAVRQFDMVIPISEEDDRKLRNICPMIKSTVIPAGVNIQAVSTDNQFVPGKILFFTNYDWAPNRDSFSFYLSEVFPKISRVVPEVQTIVAGKGTEKAAHLVRTDAFKVVGFVNDLRELRKLSSIAVIPLRIGSGIRIKMLELMALGFAVVSTRLGAEGIGLINGKHAILCDDPEDMAAAITRLLSSPEECARIGLQAQRLVATKYSAEAVGQQFYNLYMELIEGK
ncbi:MAG: glycosyltransferase family 4 protein [Candidatus Kryptoniota bacterium]